MNGELIPTAYTVWFSVKPEAGWEGAADTAEWVWRGGRGRGVSTYGSCVPRLPSTRTQRYTFPRTRAREKKSPITGWLVAGGEVGERPASPPHARTWPHSLAPDKQATKKIEKQERGARSTCLACHKVVATTLASFLVSPCCCCEKGTLTIESLRNFSSRTQHHLISGKGGQLQLFLRKVIEDLFRVFFPLSASFLRSAWRLGMPSPIQQKTSIFFESSQKAP